MDDRLLIVGYIDKNFTLTTNDKSFRFIEKRTSKEWEYSHFFDYLSKIFGPINGEFGTLLDIFKQWFEEKKRIIFNKLNNYLKECRVALSVSNWVVLHDRKEIGRAHV